MDKLKLHTADRTQAAISALAKLFPHVVTEVTVESGGSEKHIKKAIDFDLLRQTLSEELVEDDAERYRLDWPGKKASLLRANTPVLKTLRPAPEEVGAVSGRILYL
jgi:adenine-specific DNA-methyltransferase